LGWIAAEDQLTKKRNFYILAPKAPNCTFSQSGKGISLILLMELLQKIRGFSMKRGGNRASEK
jgi:hypothetical protein